MQNTTHPRLDHLIKKLPLINLFFLIPFIIFTFSIKGFESPVIVLIIICNTMMSVLATVYRIKVTDYNKNIDPKRFLVFSVSAIIILFTAMYSGCKILGWL